MSKRTFVNTTTGVEFNAVGDKADWFVRDKDFEEKFEEPKEPEIKKIKKSVKASKAKVTKKVLSENKDKDKK